MRKKIKVEDGYAPGTYITLTDKPVNVAHGDLLTIKYPNKKETYYVSTKNTSKDCNTCALMDEGIGCTISRNLVSYSSICERRWGNHHRFYKAFSLKRLDDLLEDL